MHDYGPPQPSSRIRTLIFAALFFGFAGLVNLFSPLDISINALSNGLRSPHVDPNFVILEIDDPVIGSSADHQATDEAVADLVTLLNTLEAETVVLIEPIYSGAAKFPLLTQALQADGNTVSVTAADELELDNSQAAMSEFLTSYGYFPRYFGGVEFGSSGDHYGEVFLSSPESRLSEQVVTEPTQFEIDYAFDVTAFQQFNLRDVAASESVRNSLKGKKLIVARATQTGSRRFQMPSQGNGSLAEVVMMATLTLAEEEPKDAGSFPAWLFAVIIVALLLSRRFGRRTLTAAPIALVLLFAMPVILDLVSVRIMVGHAIVMVAFGILVAWMRIKKLETANEAFTHKLSRLPSALCLSAQSGSDERVIISAVVTNYAAVCSGLTPKDEGLMARTIADALPSTRRVYQGELGQFYWLQSEFDEKTMGAAFRAAADFLNEGVVVGDRTLVLQVSFGIEMMREVALASRLKTAESAAQAAAREQLIFKVHDEAAQDELLWQSRVLFELDLAIDNREIQIALQPQLNLKTRALIGAEALVRWTHSEMGAISPELLVQVAEAGRRIERLTLHVIAESFRFLRDARQTNPDFAISVNISPKLIGSPALEIGLQAALSVYGVPAQNVILEITENENLLNDPEAKDAMLRLREVGFGLSIDDYGSGLSTVTYLLEVPANEVKLDRTLIASLTESERSRLLIASTISVAQALGMQVVAEGIEDQQTLELLQTLGCDTAQGYFVGRPMGEEDLLGLLKTQGVKSPVNKKASN